VKWALAASAGLGVGGIALYLVKQDDRSWWIGSAMLIPFVLVVLWCVRDEHWRDDSGGGGSFGPPQEPACSPACGGGRTRIYDLWVCDDSDEVRSAVAALVDVGNHVQHNVRLLPLQIAEVSRKAGEGRPDVTHSDRSIRFGATAMKHRDLMLAIDELADNVRADKARSTEDRNIHLPEYGSGLQLGSKLTSTDE